MFEKIYNSALFLAVAISLIYAACWIPFALLFGRVIPFSMEFQAQSDILRVFIYFLYLFSPAFLVYFLMKIQQRQTAFLKSKLQVVDETIESRVKLITTEFEKSFAELQTLRGIIPICSHCKDIRNGSGKWEQIEAYVQKRSEAVFSHSLCPDCDKMLYGDKRSHFQTIAGKYL